MNRRAIETERRCRIPAIKAPQPFGSAASPSLGGDDQPTHVLRSLATRGRVAGYSLLAGRGTPHRSSERGLQAPSGASEMPARVLCARQQSQATPLEADDCSPGNRVTCAESRACHSAGLASRLPSIRLTFVARDLSVAGIRPSAFRVTPYKFLPFCGSVLPESIRTDHNGSAAARWKMSPSSSQPALTSPAISVSASSKRRRLACDACPNFW